jgi:hypothetical protein
MIKMFLIAPEGFEQLATVVIALSREGALSKAKKYPVLEPYSDGEFSVLDLTEYFRKSGYIINITKETGLGVYH